MKQNTILLALIATLLVDNGVLGAQKTGSDAQRSKRSFPWPSLPSLPSFLGGSSAPVEVVEDVVTPVEVERQIAAPIISQGQIVNNQLHYPVWRVHKYNGVHLQPLPISLVSDANRVVSTGANANLIEPADVSAGGSDDISDDIPAEDISNKIETDDKEQVKEEAPKKPKNDPQVETWLSPELIKMAKRFGITDFTNLPSLQEAMDVLGTTTREETNEAIKDFAATADGRKLIRDFIVNGGGKSKSDNDVAASENQEIVQAPNDDFVGAETISQDFILPRGGDVIAQIAQLTQPARSEQQQEDEDSDEVETTTSAGILGRLSQWASFLNPLGNRQVFSIPSTAVDVSEQVDPIGLPNYLEDGTILNQNTIPIPELPALPELVIPGADLPPTQPLPTVHIPARYAGPFTSGPYYRVRLPLSGFNPTPEFSINPNYLSYGRDLLEQQQVPLVARQPSLGSAQINPHAPGIRLLQVPSAPANIQSVQAVDVQAQSAIPIRSGVQINPQAPGIRLLQVPNAPAIQPLQAVDVQPQPIPILNRQPNIHLTQSENAFAQPSVNIQPVQTALQTPAVNPHTPRIRLHQGPTSSFDQPIRVTESVSPVRAIVPVIGSTLQLPSTNIPQPFVPPQHALHVGHLPVVPTAGYEVIQTAPKALSSYGLPYNYQQYYSPSPVALDVAASEQNESVVKPKDANTDAKSANVNKIHADTKVNEIENVGQSAAIERSNSNDKIATDVDHSHNDHDQSPVAVSKDKTKTETDLVNSDIDKDIQPADVTVRTTTTTTTEAATEASSAAKETIYDNLRPSLKIMKTSREKKPTHIQRITPPDNHSGRIYRADPKHVEMMPYSMRHMAKSRKTPKKTEDVQKE